MSKTEEKNAPAITALEKERDEATGRLKDFQSFGGELVDFFHTQAFSPGVLTTSEEVCRAFSDILLRHWQLCAVTTFMRESETAPLREHDVRIEPRLDDEKVRRACFLLAAEVEKSGRELQILLDDDEGGEQTQPLEIAMREANLRAGIGVPIYAHGELPIGILVAATTTPEKLRPAIDGIRLVAAPIIIAVGNTERVKAIHEQRSRIGQLIEELTHTNLALAEANRELQRVSLYRSLFLARMSHELRTPLTSILGFAEILLDQEKLTPTQQRFCEKIQSSGVQLQTSLKQLVDLSKLEAGQMELFLHEFSLRETLRESCAAVEHLARKHQVVFDCDASLDLPTIVSDEGKLRQVLYNFFAYALSRSAAEGRVLVRAEHIKPCRFRITISDHGEPIADLATVFEPIDVGEPGATGTNLNELGLSIARRLIDVLHGTVQLDSPAPRGLNVIIELPGRPTEKQ